MKDLNLTFFVGTLVFSLLLVVLAPHIVKAAITPDEQAIIQEYLATAPLLPTKRVKSITDSATIISLLNSIQDVSKLSESKPYMSAKSLEMFTRIPNFSIYLDQDSATLYNSELRKVKITIFKGLQYALVTGTEKQSRTGYSENVWLVFVKENGEWKNDFISTLKSALADRKKANPQDLSVRGSGKTDIGITGMNYESPLPLANDSSNRFLVKIKNNGRTTLYHFTLQLEINGFEAYTDELYYTIKPKKEVIISLPTSAYWAIAGASKSPGDYITDVTIYPTPYTVDKNVSDNFFSNTTYFR